MKDLGFNIVLICLLFAGLSVSAGIAAAVTITLEEAIDYLRGKK